jgi:hypothetical protein
MHPEWSDEDISRAEKRCLMAKPYTDDEIALKVTENALVESLRRRGVRL